MAKENSEPIIINDNVRPVRQRRITRFPSLQICNHSNIQVEAMDIERNLIEIRPTITFFNLARFDPHDKTVTLFIALDTAWNDTSVSVIRKG